MRPTTAVAGSTVDTGASAPDVREFPPGARDHVGTVWRAVEAAAGSDLPPFCGWEWTRVWLEHFGDLVPHTFVVVSDGARPIGCALLTRSTARRGPLVVRRLHLGTAGDIDMGGVCVEYNGLCAPTESRAVVARMLLRHVRRLRGWDEFRLDGFRPDHARPFVDGDGGFECDVRDSPFLDLRSGTQDLVSALSSKGARATVRRSLRGLEPYTVEWATTPARAHELIGSLERLHQERWLSRGEPGAFGSERFRAFHRDIIDLWVPSNRAVVFAVRDGDGQVAAALYGFLVDGSLHFYQGGFRFSAHNKIRTGYAAHMLLADAARNRGLRSYEYLAGDSRYKTELSTGRRSLVWALLYRRSPRALAVRAARGIHASRRRRPKG